MLLVLYIVNLVYNEQVYLRVSNSLNPEELTYNILSFVFTITSLFYAIGLYLLSLCNPKFKKDI